MGAPKNIGKTFKAKSKQEINDIYNNIRFNPKEIFTGIVKTGCLPIFKCLINDYDLTSYYNIAFKIAVRKGHIEFVRILLKKFTPTYIAFDLQDASHRGFTEITKMILQNSNISAYGKNTAFLRATKQGHLEIVKLLLNNGANVNANKSKPLNLSIHYNHLDIVKYLLNYGIKLDSIDYNLYKIGKSDIAKEIRKYM